LPEPNAQKVLLLAEVVGQSFPKTLILLFKFLDLEKVLRLCFA
jgi:hypothetical protein